MFRVDRYLFTFTDLRGPQNFVLWAAFGPKAAGCTRLP